MVHHPWYCYILLGKVTCNSNRSKDKSSLICFLFRQVTYGTSNVENPDIQFRTPIALQAVFAIIILGLISMLPESPRWLMRHGKPEEAAQVLAALNEDRNVDENSYVVQEQISEIQMVLEAETGSVMDILKDKHARIPFRLCLAYGIQMMQQLTVRRNSD